MEIKGFVRYHKMSVAIIIFLIVFSTIHLLKPSIVYSKDGGFRPFGVGYLHKTVIPIWIVAIIAAILSYLFVMYYLAYC
jgi:hypothetical protein